MEQNWNFDDIPDRSGTGSMKWEPEVLVSKFGKGRENLLPLWVADMDFLCPPVVTQAMTDRIEHGIFGYTIRNQEYEQALIHWYQRRHGWKISADWIVNTPGIVPAVNYLIQRFTAPGDKVLIQPPVYYPFASSILSNGRRIAENPLVISEGRYEMDFKDLAAKAADPRVKLAILCSPHNPVGRVWTREELTRFGDICMDNNVLIFADEIHCDLVMPGYRHTSFQTLSDRFSRGSISGIAASKTFNLAGLAHSSLIITDATLREEMGIYFETLGLNPRGSSSLFGAIAAQAGYEGAGPWLTDLIDYLHGNYLFTKQELELKLPGVKVFDLEATYLPWIDFRAFDLPQARVIARVEGAGLALDHGNWFGSQGEGFERINIACPRQILKKAVSALVGAFQS